MVRQFFLVVFFSFVCSKVLLAQPLYGTLIGSEDGDILSYQCSPTSSNRISCEFTQILLSNKADESDLESSINLLMELLPDTNGDLNTYCSSFLLPLHEMFLEGVSRATVKNIPIIEEEDVDSFIKSVSEREEYFRGFSSLGFDLCTLRTEETAVAFAEFSHRENARTCTPFVNQYSQTFVKITERLYVVEASPSGVCGVINTSRFSNSTDDLNPVTWDYTASKIVSNRSDDESPICSALSEEPVQYIWNASSKRINCTFID